MDMFMAAGYFDQLDFESHNFVTGQWDAGDFKGQLKISDKFQTIYHRPTRKRMLYTVPGESPASPVIRVALTQETFIVGALQEDSHQNVHYRNVWALHKPQGQTNVYRTAPSGPPSNPGWATESLLENTFIDFELRSLNENEEEYLTPRGHYYATLPSNSKIDRGDRVTLNGETYWCAEAYWDSSMRTARMVNRPTHWDNVVYKQYTGHTYSNGQNTPTYANYNVTGRVGPERQNEDLFDINATTLKLMINSSWIGVTPALDDRVTYNSKEYRVVRIERDAIEDQWVLMLNL